MNRTVSGIIGYVAYKYLLDNEQVTGEDLVTIPSLDKMSLEYYRVEYEGL